MQYAVRQPSIWESQLLVVADVIGAFHAKTVNKHNDPIDVF
jgi:hypothetical protein